ncbi:hypothetical protein [Kribbella solani]|uniref:Uncharacterized protein n=1 Tax=Kribbella solani TaxID=236067 RepID=A0A841E1A5_9ACTN|nr:hypothetical protein [Kribbella solani]MBB5982816.1 hypothetical protein [Kribbella solani]
MRPRTARFRPGWILVSTESARLLSDPSQLAVDLTEVQDEGNGVYLMDAGAYRLIKRVAPLPAGVNAEHSLDLTDEDNGVPVVVLTLSDRLPENEIAPILAHSLAESAATVRALAGATTGNAAADRVFGPAGTPDVDAVLRPSDHGLRAELRQRGRMAERGSVSAARGVHKKIRQLALTMGVADEQPNAELRRTLLTTDELAILDRAKNQTRPLEDRADPLGYFGRSVGSSGVSSVLMGTAAAAFTGNPLVGVGIAVPTIVNAAVGSFTERRLDRQRIDGRRPAYDAERKIREQDHPGLPGLLDTPPPTPSSALSTSPSLPPSPSPALSTSSSLPSSPAKKLPMATAWRNYVTRHTVPTLATAAVAGALTPLGVPAMSTAMVIASSALAKSLAERLVDKKKLEFRLKRLDATERVRLADPDLYVSRIAAEFTDLQRRLDQLSPNHQGTPGTGTPGAPDLADVPGAPPYTVSLSSQLIENISGTARRAFVGGSSKPSANPTPVAEHLSPQVQSLLSAAGPGLLGAVTGAMGDQYFLNRDEIARDAAKLWLRGHQEAAQAAALAGVLEPRLRAFRDFTNHLETLTGTPPNQPSGREPTAETTGHGTAGHEPGRQPGREPGRELPAVTAPPVGARPLARAGWSAYAVQAAAGSLGGVAGAVGLGLVVDIPDLALVLTAAGATGTISATPAARFLFRRHELRVHEALETNKAFKAVNQTELRKQRAVARYLLAQLSIQAEAIVEHSAPRPATDPPAETSPRYTDHVRAAVRQAELDHASETPVPERIHALERVDHWAAQVDSSAGLPAARQELRSAIEQYESIADSNGVRKHFPDLGAVDPADGRRVTGGITGQVRAGTALAIRRLAVEPGAKPQLLERLIALEKLDQAANASDHHAVHGTEESRAYVQEKFDQALAEADQMWRDCGVPQGLVLPALSNTPPEPALDEDDKLRRMVHQLLHHQDRTQGLAEHGSTAHDTPTPDASTSPTNHAAGNNTPRRKPDERHNR